MGSQRPKIGNDWLLTSPYLQRCILPKPMIFELGNADLGSKTNTVWSENNKVVQLQVKYILCRSRSRTPTTFKMELFLKLVNSFMRSSILNSVRILYVPLLWTMKIQNNYEMFLHILPHLQYSVHDISIEQQPQFLVHSLDPHVI